MSADRIEQTAREVISKIPSNFDLGGYEETLNLLSEFAKQVRREAFEELEKELCSEVLKRKDVKSEYKQVFCVLLKEAIRQRGLE